MRLFLVALLIAISYAQTGCSSFCDACQVTTWGIKSCVHGGTQQECNQISISIGGSGTVTWCGEPLCVDDHQTAIEYASSIGQRITGCQDVVSYCSSFPEVRLTCPVTCGQCTVNRNCEGTWSRCNTSCRRDFITIQAQSGNGAGCPSEPSCSAGMDDCPLPTSKPTGMPTSTPTLYPTQSPTCSPSSAPTLVPSFSSTTDESVACENAESPVYVGRCAENFQPQEQCYDKWNYNGGLTTWATPEDCAAQCDNDAKCVLYSIMFRDSRDDRIGHCVTFAEGEYDRDDVWTGQPYLKCIKAASNQGKEMEPISYPSSICGTDHATISSAEWHDCESPITTQQCFETCLQTEGCVAFQVTKMDQTAWAGWGKCEGSAFICTPQSACRVDTNPRWNFYRVVDAVPDISPELTNLGGSAILGGEQTTTGLPTFAPSSNPTGLPTFAPSSNPTGLPTFAPSSNPTGLPTFAPSSNPTQIPTVEPSFPPGKSTVEPTHRPTGTPTADPAQSPIGTPTVEPTYQVDPTHSPTLLPTSNPTENPIASTRAPNPVTGLPSTTPTHSPITAMLSLAIEVNGLTDANKDNVCAALAKELKGTVQECVQNSPQTLTMQVEVPNADDAKQDLERIDLDSSLQLPQGVTVSRVELIQEIEANSEETVDFVIAVVLIFIVILVHCVVLSALSAQPPPHSMVKDPETLTKLGGPGMFGFLRGSSVWETFFPKLPAKNTDVSGCDLFTWWFGRLSSYLKLTLVYGILSGGANVLFALDITSSDARWACVAYASIAISVLALFTMNYLDLCLFAASRKNIEMRQVVRMRWAFLVLIPFGDFVMIVLCVCAILNGMAGMFTYICLGTNVVSILFFRLANLCGNNEADAIMEDVWVGNTRYGPSTMKRTPGTTESPDGGNSWRAVHTHARTHARAQKNGGNHATQLRL